MTDDKTVLMMVQDFISELPQDQQAKVTEAEKEINAVVDKYGDEGMLALSLVGATRAAE